MKPLIVVVALVSIAGAWYAISGNRSDVEIPAQHSDDQRTASADVGPIPPEDTASVIESAVSNSADMITDIDVPEANFESSTINPSFRDLTEEEQRRFEPRVDSDFYPRGKPVRYRKHRLVAIDVQEFRDLLSERWSGASEGGADSVVSIPLFEDEILDIVITDWLSTDQGFNSAKGHLSGLSPPTSVVWVHFDHVGGLKTVIRRANGSFLIQPLGEDPIYVVQSFEPLPENMPFD